MRGKICAALLPHHAEALPGRRLHHAPAVHHADLFRAELEQAFDFGFHIIGFNIKVHAACVFDPLHLDPQAVGTGFIVTGLSG